MTKKLASAKIQQQPKSKKPAMPRPNQAPKTKRTTTTKKTITTETIETVITEEINGICPECGENSIDNMTLCPKCEIQEKKSSKNSRRLLDTELNILEEESNITEFIPLEALDKGILKNE